MPSLITHPIGIDGGILARPKPKDLAPPMVDIDVAAGGAAGTGRGRFFKIPDPGLKAEILARQRSYRTHVNNITGIGIVELLPRKETDAGMIPALKNT